MMCERLPADRCQKNTDMPVDSLWKNDRGIALVFVLWVVTLLSVIVGEFCYTMRTEVNITRNFKDTTQARYIARAGINAALINAIAAGSGSQSEETETEEVTWRINAETPEIPFANGYYTVRITDELGKVNINYAPPRLLKVVLSSFELDEDVINTIVDSIQDWRDPDQFHRVNGAEDDYYQGLPEPYECKDADFDTVDELLLVKGVSEDLMDAGLRDMVSVFHVEAKDKERQSKLRALFTRINLNAAADAVLRGLPGVTDETIEIIKEYREESDFSSFDDVREILGDDIYKGIMPYITLRRSPYCLVQCRAHIAGSENVSVTEALIAINRDFDKGYGILRWREGNV